MSSKGQPPAVSAHAAKENEPEIQPGRATQAPALTAEGGTQQEAMADVSLEETPQDASQTEERVFQAANEPNSSQDRAFPGINAGKAGKGIWNRLKNFLQREAIRLLCGEKFLQRPKPRPHPGYHGPTNHGYHGPPHHGPPHHGPPHHPNHGR